MPNKPPRRMKNPPPKISLREVEQAIRGSISNKDMHQYGGVKDSVSFICMPRDEQDNLLDGLYNVWEGLENKSLNSPIPETALWYAEFRKYFDILKAMPRPRIISQGEPLPLMECSRGGQFLIYSIVNNRIYRWVLQNGRIVLWDFTNIESKFDSRTHLDDSVNFIINEYPFTEESGFNPRMNHEHKMILEKLYALLLKGAVKYLKATNNRFKYTTIVPDGILLHVPYSALIDGKNRYLINKAHPYVILESLLINPILSRQARRRPPQRIPRTNLIIGGDFSGRYYTGRLSNGLDSAMSEEAMQKELRLVAEKLNPPTTNIRQRPIAVVLRGAEATNVTFESCCQMRPKIIHIASHCSPRNPRRPNSPWGMVFLDKFLTPEKVSSHNLGGVEFVFLNACRSARNPQSATEGVGFNRAFFAAGVPTVISCLTSVQSLISAAIAVRFYQNRQEDSSIAKALHDAILSVKNKPLRGLGRGTSVHHIPSLWFGWQVYGNQ
ncbi:MAG: CHAT domain-containing protein [Desulfobacteraceae bacterium]|nr:CHAT domain-containing protein [Desulfobacteraceae bacterium]